MTCIIIEDEMPAQRILKHYINKIPDLEILACFQTALLAHDFLKSTRVDLVLLDINLPDIQGIDFIKAIPTPPRIIITTAYPDYAVSSFELETITDYLVKPISFDRFVKAIQKANKQIDRYASTSQEFLYLNVDKLLHKIALDDLVYLVSDRNYLTFVTTQQKLSIVDSLKKWKQQLQSNGFIQVHKSYLINKKHLHCWIFRG